MSILDNEGHNPLGIGNAPSRSELDRLRAEIKRLVIQIAVAERAMQDMIEVGDKADAENVRLRAALLKIEERTTDQVARSIAGEAALVFEQKADTSRYMTPEEIAADKSKIGR